MCGICGFIGKSDEIIARSVLRKMMQPIVHRGPDGVGMYTDDKAAIGFRRLAIMAPEDGDQPFYNERKNIVCVCNGEIYNYLELKKELQNNGHMFRGNSDGEVLVHAYEEWGDSFTDHLQGMYAVVIWDRQLQRLLMVRDPFGIKPLYYSVLDGNLVFASEIKSILAYPAFQKKLNMDALQLYLSFQYSVMEETFFEGVFRLMPGHRLIWKSGCIHGEPYFTPTITPDKYTQEEAPIHCMINEAVKYSVTNHMHSDTEVGLLLSGGVDSAYLAATSGVEKAYTVGFEEYGYSEFEAASIIADACHLKHRKCLISTEQYWNSLQNVQYMMDEPLADPSAVALYFLDQMAASEVKTVLSGEGADELFAGYPIYHEPISLHGYQRLPQSWRNKAAELSGILPEGVRGKGFLKRGSMTLEERFIGNAYIFNAAEIRYLLKEPILQLTPYGFLEEAYARSNGKDDITRMQEIDLGYWLWGDILLKADKMSMAHSLECRVPYLDRNVYEVARNLTREQKIHGGQTKVAFRQAAALNMPVEAAKRNKLGFPVPIRVWLRQDPWLSRVRETFSTEIAETLFNREYLFELLRVHQAGKSDQSRKIWTVYSFLVWYQAFFSI